MTLEQVNVRRDAAAEHRRRWNKLKAELGEKLDERVRVIRAGPWHITHTEAKISALAERGYDSVATAIAFDVDEHTITNHRADIRKKTGMPSGEYDFDMIFILLLPPQ